MTEQFKTRYDIKEFLPHIPKDEGELFIGFSPSPQDMQDWQNSMQENLLEEASRPLRRSVWNQLETGEQRVLIDVTECSSAEEALESLVIRLEGNELAQLDRGPADLGVVAFKHPEGLPPAVFFTRGNLCVSIISIAQQAVDVLALANRLNQRLHNQPKVARHTIELKPERDHAKVGEAVSVSYQLPWKLAELGYIKFSVHGGRISREKDSLTITGSKAGTLQLEAFVIEPGREVDGGMISINIE